MAQLRVALAQADPTVGDLEGNAAQVLALAKEAAAEGAHLVAFPEMFLTGYPVEDLALRASFVDASRGHPRPRWRPRWSTRGSATWPWWSASWTAPTDAGRGRSAGRPAARRTPRRCCTAARSSPGTPSTTCPTTACSTSTATSCRATSPCVRAGARCRRGAGDLRGPVAGRRSGRGARGRRRRPAAGHQRLAVRAQQGRRPAGAVPAAGRRGRLHAGVREHGRRPGRAGVRRRLAGRRRRRAGARTGPGSSTRSWCSSTWSCPQPMSRARWARWSAPARCRDYPAREPLLSDRLDDDAEVYAALVARPARLRAQERLPQRRARAVRRHRLRAGRRDRVRRARSPSTSTASALPSAFSSEHSRDDAADLARRTGCHLRTVPIAPMVDAFQDRCT